MSDPTPHTKHCIICECIDKEDFSPGQWKKKPSRARLCLECMELDIEDEVPEEIEERFGVSAVASSAGWTYDGPRPTRGFFTLARGASLSFSRTDPDGGIQHVFFWPSTGTTCSELLHPNAEEKTQLYRHSTAEHCREMLHLVLRNPRQHTGVGYYWASDGKYLGMGYDEADEMMHDADHGDGGRRQERSRSGGKKKKPTRSLDYFLENKLDEECDLYKLGRCYLGDYCRRQHVGNVELVPREKIDEVCRNYQNGVCRYGDLCNRIHVEGDAGHTHSDDESYDEPRQPRSKERKPTRPLEYFLENKLDEECNLYKLGRCYYGDYCRRQHVGHVDLIPREKVDEVCKNYQNGVCRYGDLCNRVHED